MNNSMIAKNGIDAQKLIEQWVKEEMNGEQFPVEFEMGWKIAGYSRKDVAKRKLDKMSEGIDFHRSVEVRKRPQGGTVDVEVFIMTCDAFKHFCLMAETEKGREIRQYFIECEKKWKLVQQVNPQFSQEIEILKLRSEIAKNEAIKAKAEESTMTLRHYVVTALPEPIQQKILGYQVIKEKEIIETVIDKASGKTYDGVGITYIAKTLGVTNKEAWGFLEQIGYGEKSGKWKEELSAVSSRKLSRDDFQYIVEVFKESKSRQLFLGE
jgi:anti-repressor protein